MRARALGLALAAAAGCVPGQTGGSTPLTLDAPMNDASQFPCSAYAYTGVAPLPENGQCVVAQDDFPGLVYVVSLSEAAAYAPGQTILLNQVVTPSAPGELFYGSAKNCTPKTCAVIPSLGILTGEYYVQPATQQQLDFDLGHPGQDTVLPVHVTYEPYFQGVDAASLGLPVTPIDGYVLDNEDINALPGPGNGPSIEFQANLEPGTYLQTVSPDPPFDAVFPPDVNTVTAGVGGQKELDEMQVDTTRLEGLNGTAAVVPTFDLSPLGELVGWTAYLRDATTRQRISSLATVGKGTTTVTLPTNHHPAGGDALDDAQLVVAPPAGKPIPAFIESPQAGLLPYSVVVPTLPPTVTVTGAVTAADLTTPVEAELVFESIAGAASTQGIYTGATNSVLNTSNFEYTAYVATSAAMPGGPATYSVELPPGDYQLTVIPSDTAYALAVQTSFVVLPGTSPLTKNVPAGVPLVASGKAVLADQRPLAGATVQALPVACFQGTGTACTPRGGQTTTLADGSYALALDPGSYALRIEPADGTGFPWVVQPLLVSATDVGVPTTTVPLPVLASFRLADPNGNAVIDAVVRAYELPTSGQAVEVGRAMTDVTGSFTMYLTPTQQ